MVADAGSYQVPNQECYLKIYRSAVKRIDLQDEELRDKAGTKNTINSRFVFVHKFEIRCQIKVKFK